MWFIIIAVLIGIFFWPIMGYVIGFAFFGLLAFGIRALIMYLTGYDVDYCSTFLFLMCFLWFCKVCIENR